MRLKQAPEVRNLDWKGPTTGRKFHMKKTHKKWDSLKKRASESPKIYDLCIKKARESPKFAIRAQKKAQESPKFARKKGPF